MLSRNVPESGCLIDERQPGQSLALCRIGVHRDLPCRFFTVGANELDARPTNPADDFGEATSVRLIYRHHSLEGAGCLWPIQQHERHPAFTSSR